MAKITATEVIEQQIARIDKLIAIFENDLRESDRTHIAISDMLSARIDDLRQQRNELQRTEA